MEKVVKIVMAFGLAGFLLSCAGQPVSDGNEFADDTQVSEDTGGADDSSDSTELAETDESGELSESTSQNGEEDLASLDSELNDELQAEQKKGDGSDEALAGDPLAEDSKKDKTNQDPQLDSKEVTQAEEAPVLEQESKDPLSEKPAEESTTVMNESIVEPPPEDSSNGSVNQLGKSEIRNIKFEGNEGGGSVVIEGNQPLNYTSRLNAQTNQYVIEIKNARLPEKLKRPYITKDFQSAVGGIDAYQNPGSENVQVVVQLREGASEPTAHIEGNSIIIVPSGGLASASAPSEQTSETESSPDALSTPNGEGGILSSRNIETFLSGNMKYYGKRINIEVKDIEVRSAINLIAEMSGANLIMSEGVTGNLAIKLKNVPWDQALVLILKAKKLGYTRQGNVLRIATMAEIKQEEEDAMKLVESRRKVEDLKVQMIPINYAKTTELESQLKKVISERGSIVSDARTNSLILTDTEAVLERARKIISNLDIAPAQVLIEGKLVEARESFTKRIGIQWSVAGIPVQLGDGPMGPVNMVPNLTVRPGGLSPGSLGFNITLGTLDVLGDLNTVLSLEEQEENVKVISSPRIVTLHNEEAKITQVASISIVKSENKKDGTRTFEDIPLKMELKVKPEVANNGMVQMQVDILRQFAGAFRSDGTAGNHSRSATTKVMVKSGQTAVIGGIYQNDSAQMDNGVPWLKDIPILGYLFRGTNFRKDKTELLLFLTPRVLSQAGNGVASLDSGTQVKDLDSPKGMEGSSGSDLE